MRGTTTPLTKGPFSLTIPDTAGHFSIPADGTGSTLSEDLLSWLVNVDVFMTPITQTNWNNATVDPGHTHIYNAYSDSSGAQNDEIGFDVVLAAGTWTVEVIYAQNLNYGIASVRFDGVEKGTVDGYGAAEVRNVRTQITGIAVSTTGKVRLLLKIATKNASSNNYFFRLQHIQLRRTA